MSWRLPFTVLALSTGLALSSFPVVAQPSSSEEYRVLAKADIGLSLDTVEKFLKDGDELFLKGNYSQARKKYDKARDMAKLLLGFYGDLSNSFKGVDALIPREMDSNSRKVLALISKANLKLASLFRKNNQSALAVPLLVEVVRISGPAKKEGNQAYKELVELGFVNTPFRGGRKRP